MIAGMEPLLTEDVPFDQPVEVAASQLRQQLFGELAERVNIQQRGEDAAVLQGIGMPDVMIRPDAVGVADLPGQTWPLLRALDGSLHVEGIELIRDHLQQHLRTRAYMSPVIQELAQLPAAPAPQAQPEASPDR